MSWIDGVRQRLRETVAADGDDSVLEEEMRYHIDRETERLMGEGLGPEQARAEARRRFGGEGRAREDVRSERGFRWLESARRELRFAARALRKNPGFTAAAVATLALGIGATTALFSVLNGVVLRPLPYADASRIVSISHTDNEGDDLGMPDAAYFAYGDEANSLSELAVYLEVSDVVTGTGEPMELALVIATPSLFRVFQMAPLHGRLLSEADAEPGAPDVAVLTHGFWMEQFGGDEAAVGQSIPGSSMEIVGILPPEFEFARADASVVFGNAFDRPDAILPLTMRRANARFGNFIYQGVGRLADGATPDGSQAELLALMPRAAEQYEGGHTPASLAEGGHRPVVRELQKAIVGDLASTLWILLGAVGLVLLIATANVANLFLARAEARRREIAVRRSLGAGLGVLARSSMAEGLLLAGLGGVLAVGLAVLATQVLLGLAPADLPRLDDVTLGFGVLGFALGLTLLTGLFFGTVPLLAHATTDARGALGEESRGGTAARGRQRIRRALVAVQVGLVLILWVGAGLLLRTFGNLRDIDPGFDSTGVLTFRTSLHGLYGSDVEVSAFLVELTEALEAVPGVERAAFSADLPLDGDEWRDDVAIEGAVGNEAVEGRPALRVFIGPGYLEAIGARLIRGRELERLDFDGYPEFVVVNQSFAEQRWPGEDPIGRRIMQGGNDPDADVWYTVSGVVADIREASLMTPPEPTVYLPTVFKADDEYGMFVRNLPVVLRTTSADPASLFPAVEQALREHAPEVPINSVRSLDDVKAASFQQVSFAMTLVVIAGIVAVIIGFVGIYGVIAYLASLRRREFGVRLALGALPRRLGRAVVGEGVRIGAIGLVLGVVASLLVMRILGALLFGVAATDALTYATAFAGVLVVVLLASLIPARRAAAVDPAEAIRAD